MAALQSPADDGSDADEGSQEHNDSFSHKTSQDTQENRAADPHSPCPTAIFRVPVKCHDLMNSIHHHHHPTSHPPSVPMAPAFNARDVVFTTVTSDMTVEDLVAVVLAKCNMKDFQPSAFCVVAERVYGASGRTGRRGSPGATLETHVLDDGASPLDTPQCPGVKNTYRFHGSGERNWACLSINCKTEYSKLAALGWKTDDQTDSFVWKLWHGFEKRA